MSDKLDITLEDQEPGVSAEALRALFDKTMAFLEADTHDEGVTWRVTHVSMNSPFTMTVERSMPPSMAEPAHRPAERLVRGFAALAANQPLDDDWDLSQAQRMSAMAQVAAQNGNTVRLQAGRGAAVVLDAQWAGQLRTWVKQKTQERAIPDQYYSTVGRLEGVDVHGKKSEFYVYDPLTDKKMRCLFKDDLLGRVKSSLNERVEVSGLTKFNAQDEAIRMEADSLRVVQTRPFLKRLQDAQRRGVMNLTGGLSVDDALEEVRNGAH